MIATRPRKRPPTPLRLELRVPTLQFLPGLQVDPLQALTGRTLAELLAGVLERPPESSGGQMIYRVSLAEGVGLALPLGHFGELSLENREGQLQLTAPSLAAFLLNQLPYQQGPPQILQTSTGRCARFTLAPPPGAHFHIPVIATSLEIFLL